MQKQLLKYLRKFSKNRIFVVGDLIADEFLHGQVSRISREAPVLVLDCRDMLRLPGGAANAANNLLALGADVAVAGVVGNDEPGREILRLLKEQGADISAVSRSRIRSTPRKTRILAGAHHSAPHQIVRVDRGNGSDPSPRFSRKLLESCIRNADAVILSDYGYNSISAPLLSELRIMAKEKGIPILADSRFRMMDYAGITAITPNITELEDAVGVSIQSDPKRLNEAARSVLDSRQLEYLLVTQGKFGMTLFENGKEPLHIPIYGTDEVADVTGAGDTVISVFTLALASGATAADAARLANYAGGIVVMKQGTATVSRVELRKAVERD